MGARSEPGAIKFLTSLFLLFSISLAAYSPGSFTSLTASSPVGELDKACEQEDAPVNDAPVVASPPSSGLVQSEQPGGTVAPRGDTSAPGVLSDTNSAQNLPYHRAQLASHSFRIMLARTSDEKTRGLMFFTNLDPDAGMLFVYPNSQRMVFWMKNTLVPLDLVFFDDQLRVTEYIESMQPGGNRPESRLPRYGSRYPARYALELGEGSIKRFGIHSGQRLEIPLPFLFSSDP